MPSWRTATGYKKPVAQYVILPFIYELDSSRSDYLIHPTIYNPTFKDTLVLDTIIFRKHQLSYTEYSDSLERDFDKYPKFIYLTVYTNDKKTKHNCNYKYNIEVNGRKAYSADSMNITNYFGIGDSSCKLNIIHGKHILARDYFLKKEIKNGGDIRFYHITDFKSLMPAKSIDSLYYNSYFISNLYLGNIDIPKSITLSQLKALNILTFTPDVPFGDPVSYMTVVSWQYKKKYLRKQERITN